MKFRLACRTSDMCGRLLSGGHSRTPALVKDESAARSADIAPDLQPMKRHDRAGWTRPLCRKRLIALSIVGFALVGNVALKRLEDTGWSALHKSLSNTSPIQRQAPESPVFRPGRNTPPHWTSRVDTAGHAARELMTVEGARVFKVRRVQVLHSAGLILGFQPIRHALFLDRWVRLGQNLTKGKSSLEVFRSSGFRAAVLPSGRGV